MASSTHNRLSEYLPLLAFAAAWSLQLIYFLGYDERTFQTYGTGVIGLILVAVASYIIGFFSFKILPLGTLIPSRSSSATAADLGAARLLMQITIVMSALLITTNILLPLSKGISLSGAREIALENWENGDILTRLSAVAANVTLAFALMAIIDRMEFYGKFPFLLVIMFVTLTIAAYSRAHLLLGLSVVSTKWIARSKYRLTYIFLIFIAFAALFSVLSVVASVGSADRAGGLEDIYKSLEVYTFGGVAGFEFFYATGQPQYQALLTMPRFMYSILPGLGNLPPSYFPFIDTVPPINVFSALYPPYHDFGRAGLVTFFVVYGFLSAAVALAFQRRPGRTLCVLAGFLLYAALMSPFDDQFIRGLTILVLMLSSAAVYSFLFHSVRASRG
ncbi:O-antigen polymerase [Sphingomonas sp. BK580]|uniref:O-antigen polymerase n=1 Tax=Sphingomonas sp. BK580 TaxID=2586972 RepID=UPI0016210097|nr:O-antigen polymerase [Sphingomonas sp. BK580]MBB3693784.1 oligosaccharide repeat unit polymerase [Sphingomonas sp. BK580]